MEIVTISKRRFETLEPLVLPNSVFNTECTLHILPQKSKWQSNPRLLKKFYITNGVKFGNKLQTINALLDCKDTIDIEELVMPEKMAAINGEICGYIMPLIDSINLVELLSSFDTPAEDKIKYLKQIGMILEKMKKVREYTFVKEFYLNDIHESNFILDKSSQTIKVVDMDSCKINDNYTFPSKYLSTLGLINGISKYQKETKAECGAIYKPTEDTELYCYIIMILNCLYHENINSMSLECFYDYLEYLESIGIEKELIDIFERIVSNSHNINPYELLDSLPPFLGRSNYHVYKHIKRKTN